MCCHYLLENRFVLICQQSRIITIIPAAHIQIDIIRPSIIAIAVDVLVHLYALQVFSSYSYTYAAAFVHVTLFPSSTHNKRPSQQKYRCYSCRCTLIVSIQLLGMYDVFRYSVPFAVLAQITNNALIALLNRCSKSIQPTNS